MEEFKPGKLTALIGSTLPMTVTGYDDGSVFADGQARVRVQWFDANDNLREGQFIAATTIGAGDELVFRGGAFIRAQSLGDSK